MPTVLTLTPAGTTALLLAGPPIQLYPSSTTYPGISSFPGVVPLTLAAASSTSATLTPAGANALTLAAAGSTVLTLTPA